MQLPQDVSQSDEVHCGCSFDMICDYMEQFTNKQPTIDKLITYFDAKEVPTIPFSDYMKRFRYYLLFKAGSGKSLQRLTILEVAHICLLLKSVSELEDYKADVFNRHRLFAACTMMSNKITREHDEQYTNGYYGLLAGTHTDEQLKYMRNLCGIQKRVNWLEERYDELTLQLSKEKDKNCSPENKIKIHGIEISLEQNRLTLNQERISLERAEKMWSPHLVRCREINRLECQLLLIMLEYDLKFFYKEEELESFCQECINFSKK